MRGGSSEGGEGSALRWVVVALILGVIGFFAIKTPEPAVVGQPEGLASATTTAVGPPTPAPPVPRCKMHGAPGGYRIGEGPARRDVGKGGQGAGEDPLLLPFSVELGRGAATARGFAVGIKRDREGGSWNEVAVVDSRVDAGRLVSLGRSRGDLDAPIATDLDGGWVAGILEPHASGLALRLARPRADGSPAWGAEIEQGRDESLAVDLAFAEQIGVAVWDDVIDDGARAVVVLATVKPDDLLQRGESKVVSRESVDGELPRVVPREGGFWLAYVARERLGEEAKRTEGQYAAERIDPSWIELLPLDAEGAPMGEPRPVTPREGHVLAFDLAPGDEGAIVAWRDDDTPLGAHGGSVRTIHVGASGEGQLQEVAEDGVGSGVPVLVGRWLALPDEQGIMQLAPLDGEGTVTGEFRLEPALGRAQVIAAQGDLLLGARPAGRAVELITVQCERATGGP